MMSAVGPECWVLVGQLDTGQSSDFRTEIWFLETETVCWPEND